MPPKRQNNGAWGNSNSQPASKPSTIQPVSNNASTPSAWQLLQPVAIPIPSNKTVLPNFGPKDKSRRSEVWAIAPTNILAAAKPAALPGSQSVDIVTNFIAVTKIPKSLYVYLVEIYKIVDSMNLDKVSAALDDASASASSSNDPTARQMRQRGEKARVFEALRTTSTSPLYGRTDWATDYINIWSETPLFNNQVPGQTTSVQGLTYKKANGSTVPLDKVIFTYQNHVSLPADTGLQGAKSLVNKDDDIQKLASVRATALNALISRNATMQDHRLITVGPNKLFLGDGFQPISFQRPASSLNVHRGYFMSVRPGQSNILLNVGTKAGAFYNPIKVSDFMDSYDSETRLPGGALRVLKGVRVRVLYHNKQQGSSNVDFQERTIAGFGQTPSQQTFDIDKKPISVRDYFIQTYGPKATVDDRYFCANVGLARPGSEMWIPVQFLQILPKQPFKGQLEPAHMTQMLANAQWTAPETQRLIALEGIPLLGLTQSNSLNIAVNTDLIQLKASLLPKPQIIFKDERKPVDQTRASWSVADSKHAPLKFFKPGVLSSPRNGVHVISCVKSRSDDLLKLAQAMTDQLFWHGIHIEEDYKIGAAVLQNMNALYDDDLLKTAFKGIIEKEWKEVNDAHKIDYVLVILPNDNADNYARIKRVLDQDMGIHSACSIVRKILKPNQGPDPQMLSNLSLKYNMKFLGQSHAVHTASKQSVSVFASISKNTIVLGADVSHAPSQMDECPSVAAVVGSDDPDFCNFPGSMRLQAAKQEIIEDLADMVKERVYQYAFRNKAWPQRMIFYRDGVGEDQFSEVRSKELPRIQRGIDMASHLVKEDSKGAVSTSPISITLIIVSKRHNTRFFTKNKNETSHNGNAKPGLLVDNVITRPNQDAKDQVFDFYLQSHNAILGTARPAHYIVLQKGSFEPQDIKSLTHGFCYNFGRSTTAVSYVSPAYFADRLAERGTHYLKGFTSKLKSRSPPELPKKPKELLPDHRHRQGDKTKEQALADWRKAIAATIMGSDLWVKPAYRQMDFPPYLRENMRRMNPWVPAFDKCMFWL